MNVIDLNNLTESEREAILSSGYLADFEGQKVYSEEYVEKLRDTIEKLVDFVINCGEYKGDNIPVLDSYLHLADRIRYNEVTELK